MRVIVIFLLLVSAIAAPAQSLSKEKIIGEWNVMQVAFLSVEPLNDTTTVKAKEFMKIMRDGFTNATFIFTNEAFSFKFPIDVNNMITEELVSMNGKSWDIDAKNLIAIGGKENLMGIRVLERDNATIFYLDESPVVLLVEKVK